MPAGEKEKRCGSAHCPRSYQARLGMTPSAVTRVQELQVKCQVGCVPVLDWEWGFPDRDVNPGGHRVMEKAVCVSLMGQEPCGC